MKPSNSLQYIGSDERTTSEIAEVLSKAANNPGVPYVVFSDKQALDGMRKSCLADRFAEAYTSIGKGVQGGENAGGLLGEPAGIMCDQTGGFCQGICSRI